MLHTLDSRLFTHVSGVRAGNRLSTDADKEELDETTTYNAWKQRAVDYQAAKTCLLDQCFSQWVQTPKEFEAFTATADNDGC
ncbi:hypothetical protein BDB00DRAFT_805165, partial [Zychaea mexicana]|uniref:uncharacterized protein n=1 Tax=Zychaea mexicana TaxID=64656 RepID=UPI0022FE7BAC